jgi:hypothetical protein
MYDISIPNVGSTSLLVTQNSDHHSWLASLDVPRHHMILNVSPVSTRERVSFLLFCAAVLHFFFLAVRMFSPSVKFVMPIKKISQFTCPLICKIAAGATQ